jgi:putative membrane protein
MNAVTQLTTLIAGSGLHHDGAWWFPFGLLWLVLLAGLVWVVAHRVGPRERSSVERAGDILAERYARGEIDAEEYRERLAELRSHA